MGGDFPRRWTQTREALEVMKLLWTQDEAEYHGRYFDFPKVRCYPKPMQKPYPPILIGGMAPNVLQRIVDHADGWLPNRLTPEQLRQSRKELSQRAEEAGRDPDSLSIMIYGQLPDRALVESLFEAGADGVIVRPQRHEDNEDAMAEQLNDIAQAVL